jgi:YbgC/YbaW family acyl-CoA thioester hydrolase
MDRSEFRFFDRLRVRWAEIDAQRIVFNGHYLMYFDTAVAGYWRALALPYAQSMESMGGDLYVRKATLEYLGSAHYDDMLDVGMRCARVGNSSIRFEGGVFRREELLVSCELVYVFADPQSQTAKPVPQQLRDILQGYEAGQSMLELHVGSWSEIGKDAQSLRTQVFVAEYHQSAALAFEPADETAVHAVARNLLGMPLATGRLVQQTPGVARIGRMAVSQALRGSGVGRAILDELLRYAKQRGEREVVLTAHIDTTAFYRRAGFTECGPSFDKAGVAQVEMTRSI